MCGICGQFNYRNLDPVRAEVIRAMTRTMVHRGPDDEGEYLSGPLGFGFRRLSIIDLGGGHQPMSNQNQTVWVVFNGEIYNFPVLRKELEARGYVFQSRSDTEVIVHGYEEWGLDVLDHLNGMFGFAVWDEKARRLVLARDRAGIKPLYYKLESDRLFFGSEVRAILAGTGEKAELDPVSLNLFLRYRYTPSPLTLFKRIRKLAPGTRLVIENGECRVERYWNYRAEPFSPMPSVEQAESELLDLYKQAVRRQLISDVPLGLLLSGGLDSGLLLALMNLEGTDHKTFTVGYGESFADDELSEAAATAKALGARNYSVRIDRATFESTLPKIMSYLEEPVASASVVPMYFVCQKAREEVTVALVGQGPDEMFAGYKRHLGVHYGAWWRTLPAWLRAVLKEGLSLLPRSASIKRGLYSLDVPDRMRRYQQVFSIMPADVIDSLFKDGLLPAGAGDRILECWDGLEPLLRNMDELGGFNYLEVRSSLPDELLIYADKLSMAHSLELRVPYLDHDIVEYVERLSTGFKIRYGSSKWLHRRVCRRFLPGEVVRRRKKGFAVNVVDDWFRNSITGKIQETLMDDASLMYGYLRPEAVRGLVRRHQAGESDNHKILFSLVVLEEWLRHFTSK
jgi:asparagine synthase (glutamine-hydrolysing)